jgi:nitroreductase
MSETLKTIRERRSVRSFSGEPVTREETEALLEAACWAPSAMNAQAVHVTAVCGLPRIGELDAALKAASAKPGFDRYKGYVGGPGYSINFRGATLFLIAGADRTKSFCPVEDASLALGNMLLAAHALGLGAVWINQLGPVCDEPGFRKALTGLGFPESHVVVGCAAVGRRKGANPPPPPRVPGRSNIVGG